MILFDPTHTIADALAAGYLQIGDRLEFLDGEHPVIMADR